MHLNVASPFAAMLFAMSAAVAAADSSPTAVEKVVDRLLASPRFGERWARHWLDVARYADSSGKETNLPYPHAWRYRDWVIAAFNADKPYDQFLKEQRAGDLLNYSGPADQAHKIIAAGFLALGPKGLNESDSSSLATTKPTPCDALATRRIGKRAGAEKKLPQL